MYDTKRSNSMSSMSNRLLALAVFNGVVAIFCCVTGLLMLSIDRYDMALINFICVGANGWVTVSNYRLMQKYREREGLEPFSVGKIKTPQWLYNFMQKYLYK